MRVRGPACKDVLDSILRVDPGRRSRSIRQYPLSPDGGGRRMCLSVVRVFEKTCIPKGATAQKEREYPNDVSSYEPKVRRRVNALESCSHGIYGALVSIKYAAHALVSASVKVSPSGHEHALRDLLGTLYPFKILFLSNGERVQSRACRTTTLRMYYLIALSRTESIGSLI